MKARTRTILAACFAIAIFNNFGTSVEVSSNVDLDSDESEETLLINTTSSRTIVNLNIPANTSESVLRASKPSIITWQHGRGLVKSSEPRKRRIYPSHDDCAKRPKIINNIQIVVNSNDSMPNTNSCKYGICDVSVSSKPDEKGNIITEVHLSIITNVKPDVKIDDIPVIDGFPGVDEDHEEQPIFQSIIVSNPVHSHLHRDNIPQIQTNDQRYGQSWYQHRRTLQPPQTYWSYRYSGNRGNVGFRERKIWHRDRPVVDDKIEPPLSKTKFSDDANS